MSQRIDLNNKVVMITGASRGIGEATAIRLAKEGMKLCLVSRSEDKLQNVAAKCSELGAESLVLPCDLSRPEQTKQLVAQCIQKFGRLDVLFNNAGDTARYSADEADLADWDRVLNLNLKSLIHLTRHALPEIKKSKGGAIINLASISGKMTSPKGGIYCATKHAVMGFTGSLFEDVREHNIKVSAICPGFVNTELVNHNPKLDATKMIQPEDCAETVYYILNLPLTACPTEIILRPQRTPYK